MKYKITNWLPPTENGEEVRFEVVYESFEEAVSKITRDLNSFWKGMLPRNLTFNIVVVDDSVKTGMRYFVNDEELAYNPKEVTEALEVSGDALRKNWADIDKPAGMTNRKSFDEMMRLLSR
jgi:spermidine/putrescine-binding protein